MRTRYSFLSKKDEYNATNMVRNAFLAAKNGNEVEEIINAILTSDEIIKVGRRIQIANMLASDYSGEEVKTILGVGRDTITLVAKHLVKYPIGFKLVYERSRKVEKIYNKKKFDKVGGPTLVKKKKVYSGFSRKNVER